MFPEESTLYSNRPDWKDVTPIKQDDGPHSVVSIAYQERFVDVYDYFRAILASGEKSDRALDLTKNAIYMNAANYTVWEYRRQILVEMKKDLREELEFVAYVIDLHPKNYQVWHHRQALVKLLSDPSGEKDLTAHAFREDPKNYHAWQHRLWCVRTYNFYDGELDFTEEMLNSDVRNNSAWNYRYSMIQDTTKFTPDVVESELKFTVGKIKLAENNESAWNYLKGVLFQKPEGLGTSEYVNAYCWDSYLKGSRSPYLLSTMVEIIQDKLGNKKEVSLVEEAAKLCTELADKEDTIRAEYWNYMKRRVSSKFS
ncbi:unnamed protein product [Notodromas monacha]|uniref:Protein farnesyltransferase/geranylgeranyltransferase type-1 subunit alpha n=1 Tax=Notodromas monacha TaxID=399045 RepID=A0A7R9BQX3_9CRUS|nr:unnamed protein product [Notodromas monacha]CAG0919121.1 unnamed protein product [Notodromas monacha]